MKKTIFLFLVTLFCTRLRAVAPDSRPPEEFRIGPSLQLALPSHLPDFTQPIPLYGAAVNLPFYEHAIQPSVNYGTGNGVTAFYSEVSARINFSVPFFSPFALAGVHYLSYSYANSNHNFFGGQAGIGLNFKPDSFLQIQVAMKLLLEQQRLLSFGGMLLFRL